MTILYENQTDENQTYRTHSGYWFGQTFTPQINHFISKITLKLGRWQEESGPSLGTITVEIYETNGDGFPTGSALCSGTTDGDTLPDTYAEESCEERNISFSSSTFLEVDTKYAILVKAPGADASGAVGERTYIDIRQRTISTYLRGNKIRYKISTEEWSSYDTVDLWFKEWGTVEEPSIPIPPWPEDRPATYEPDNAWGYNPATEEYEWVDAPDIMAAGGGRYGMKLIVIGHETIYYSS